MLKSIDSRREKMAESALKHEVDRVSVALGAVVENFDLASGVSQGDIDYLRDLIHEHHLLQLPNQHLTALQLEAFGRKWGDLLTHPATKHRDTDYVQFIGGRDRYFKFSPGVHPARGGWHSDMTWHATPPRFTGLLARKLPSSGGDTAFANQHLAYETLDDETKDEIDGLHAFHTGKVFGPDVEDAVHPVVRTHDATGKKALFVNPNFTKYIVDMEASRSTDLLYRLFFQASRPEFQYRHKWQLNDLVLWDNQALMHYAVADYSETRIMHRIVVKGDKPF